MTTPRSSLLRLGARALIVAAALAPATASAQPAPGDSMAVAEALFQQARELFKQDHYAEACPKFAESQRLDPKLGTLLNLAVCHEKLGKTASAWAEYTSAAAIARRDGRKDREEFARDQVAALEKKLARVVLTVATPPPGLRLTWDDQPLDSAVLGAALPVDPGRHRISATAPGRVPWSTLVEVPSTPGQVPVPIPTLEAEAPPPPPPAPVVVTPPIVAAPIATAPAPPPPVPVPPRRDDARIFVITGFSVGAAGVLVAAVSGGVALQRAAALHAADVCPLNHCKVGTQGAIDDATTAANAANVGVGFAVAGVGVGIAGLLLSPRAPAAPAAAITPLLGPGFIGARGRF